MVAVEEQVSELRLGTESRAKLDVSNCSAKAQEKRCND